MTDRGAPRSILPIALAALMVLSVVPGGAIAGQAADASNLRSGTGASDAVVDAAPPGPNETTH